MNTDTRTFTCQAPGCGREFTPRRSQVWNARVPKYCSQRCRTAYGKWSYPATHPTLERVYGVTRS